MLELSALASGIVSAITSLLPMLASSGVIPDAVVTLLLQLIPYAVKEAEALVTPIENIISTLRSSGSITPAQMAAVEASRAAAFAAFDATAAAQGDPDPAPAPASG